MHPHLNFMIIWVFIQLHYIIFPDMKVEMLFQSCFHTTNIKILVESRNGVL